MAQRSWTAAALVVLVLGSVAVAAHARTVDYSLDQAALDQAAAEQRVGQVSLSPSRGDLDLAFSADPGTDHVTLALGNHCSAYKVENPVSQMLRALITSWDRDGTLAEPGGVGVAAIRLTKASSYNRCVMLKETDGRCITRVKLAGTVSLDVGDGVARSFPIAADVEKSGTVGGFCGNIARFIGIVSREAGIELIADARTKLAVE
ncbi:MAG: hypothetical protein ACREEJ_16080, partial [Ensifer adhaerens]